MALRPIDNALPTTTPERPKKQPKIAVATQKQQDRASVNGENVVPLPSSEDATVDYVSSDNLKPLADPEVKIQSLVEDLDSKNWIKVCESLNDVRRFSLLHSSLLFPILGKIVLVVAKTMRNPRSALCKTAIMAAADIFSAFGDKLLEPETSDAFDGLLLQLLLKASQDKRFVCEEADRALGIMVGSMTPLPLLKKLRVYVSHKNLRVRAKAAVSLSNCVSKMGLEEMEQFGLAELIEVAADLLNDRLPEARDAARSIATSMYKALTKDSEEMMELWQSFCQSKLPPIHALSILKIVKP
ncbi:TOG array regulator of axonemal microtubules protein 2-like [Glycine soja]|uniref:TOG array regulator of axonemal microtubules protein 1 n=1 Tax=Glycine soja TaxID=3848 RepID=A0A445IWP2_GLYSO|nr:TOG array regulator of axonemal microtubules protein 2-like [Glycine soja]KHN26554.1 Protein FAM179B-like protein [Glycine soja]RZB90587.1 TOG array regulator of axonemal microtubules protein 1 [Glycine soja]